MMMLRWWLSVYDDDCSQWRYQANMISHIHVEILHDIERIGESSALSARFISTNGNNFKMSLLKIQFWKSLIGSFVWCFHETNMTKHFQVMASKERWQAIIGIDDDLGY